MRARCAAWGGAVLGLLACAVGPSGSAATGAMSLSPWQTAAAGPRVRAALPKAQTEGYLPHHFAQWAPAPSGPWRPAPNGSTVGYRHTEQAPCEETAAYLRYRYFRTVLTAAPGARRADARLAIGIVGDAARVTVNGRTAGDATSGSSVRVGPLLRPGPNAVTILLADWCGTARLEGVRLVVPSGAGGRGAVRRR